MLVSVTNCVSHGGALFFRKPREARPIECSLLDLHELAGETGISVDDVISRLDDFASADALLGVGAPFFTPPSAQPALDLAATEEISLFTVHTPLDAAETILEQTAAIFEAGPEPFRGEPEAFETNLPEADIIIEETSPIFAAPAPAIEAEPAPTEPETAFVIETEPPAPEPEIVIEAAPVFTEPSPALEEAPVFTEPVIEEPAPAIETAPAAGKTEAPAPAAPVQRKLSRAESPLAKMTRVKLEKIRRCSTVRVEAAEPENCEEDEPLMDMTVPEGYAVQTTTENIVWPWEIREDLTLKEALESLDDKLLTSLTEEVVSCTISGEMGEGGIKSLCETYGRAKEQIYSAIQHESRRRITRMNTKPHTGASSPASDATQEMAMRMAKQFLQNEMGKKPMRFESPFPDENGIRHIIQSHRVEDEANIDFPNERVYYREIGDGWAISVGY